MVTNVTLSALLVFVTDGTLATTYKYSSLSCSMIVGFHVPLGSVGKVGHQNQTAAINSKHKRHIRATWKVALTEFPRTQFDCLTLR